MRSRLRDNGLTLAMIGFFLIFLAGQTLTGLRTYNQERQESGAATVELSGYLRTGHFVEATFENWESEYLQMAVYVFFTVFLYQRGSAESKDPDKREPVDEDPRGAAGRPGAPWPVRVGGVVLRVYEHSLTIALFSLFLISFVLHARGGSREYSEQLISNGGEAVSTWGYMTTAQFWFQSFQNWQSEFLAVATLAFLSVYLRQRGSPESKPVAAPHSQTGG